MQKQTFVDTLVATYPEIVTKGFVTRKQITDVLDKHEGQFTWPGYIINKENRIDRGVFRFDIDRINMDMSSSKSASSDGLVLNVPEVVTENDEELRERITETYGAMEELIELVANNHVNSLIIAGAPGLGKSFETNGILSAASSISHVFHRGYLKATHIFRLLWENRLPGQTVVIDDCDSIFDEPVALNLLKAALELKKTRMVSWGSEKNLEDQDGEKIPRTFDYEGSIIFLTNLEFSNIIARGTNKNAVHLAALESRSLVLDLGLSTQREIMMKVRMTVEKGMLRSMGVDTQGEQLIMTFLEKHMNHLKTPLSLRSPEKLAILYKSNPDNWELIARRTMLTPGFQRSES